jgi:hypothetical protein
LPVGAILLASPGAAFALFALRTKSPTWSHRPSEDRRSPNWFASQFEERAFRRLEVSYPPPKFIISAHMLLADVVGRSELPQLRPHDREFCWKAHCDFVVVERATMKISRVVEVNGPHHRLPAQTVRDWRKAAILRQFDIALDIVFE